MPKCTIAIPVYNREDFIENAIESAISQDISDLEILVVDNHSTDDTWNKINRFKDKRIRSVRNATNIGLFGNFNECLRLATGAWVRFLCSDDQLPKNCLVGELAHLETKKNCVMLATRMKYATKDGKEIQRNRLTLPPGDYQGKSAIVAIFKVLAKYGFNLLPYPSAALIKRDAAIIAGGFDTTYKGVGDVDLYLRLLERGNLSVIDTLGALITVHQDQEGAKLHDAIEVVEWNRTRVKQSDTINAAGKPDRLLSELAALWMALAMRYRLSGNRSASKVCLGEIQTLGVSKKKMLIDLAKLTCRQIRLRVFPGTPRIPHTPCENGENEKSAQDKNERQIFFKHL